jgi:nucleoside-diphosphate-sugar epimerase
MSASVPNALRGASVLVTGGAGFIGSHLVDGLVTAGASVRVLDDFSSGRHENLAHHSDLEVIEGDIRDPDACARACEGVRFVFHEAALGSVPRSMTDPVTTMSVNVTGTTTVLTAARDAAVERVVYASSSSVYGDSEALPKVEGKEGRPLSPYALSKVVNEQTAEVFGACFGMELVGLRYFNVYGPRQDPSGPYAAVIPLFMAASVRGEAAVILGEGDQSRDFTYVEDVVRANLLAATAPAEACGRAFNIGSGTRTTVRELAILIGEIAGSTVPPMHAPPRAGDVLHSQADPSAAKRDLSFEVRCALADGLRTTYSASA